MNKLIRENRKILIITSVAILLPILFGVFFWNQLPDRMATHWGVSGEPDGYSSKAFAVFGLPLIVLGLHWICVLGTAADPKKSNHSEKILKMVFWICPVVSLLCSILTYAYSLGIEVNVGFWVLLFMGIVFMIVGNYLPKCKQSYTIGIKLPWTLHDPENWNKTHRLGGFLWTVGGAVIALTSPLANPWIVFPIIFVMVLVPTVYSWRYAVKKEKE